MDPVTPAEVGRFTYVYSVPDTYTDGDMLYAEVNGEDAVANLLAQDVEVVLIAATRSGTFTTGLIIEFVES
jgi:predicted thioredoxin/glutaredoxin